MAAQAKKKKSVVWRAVFWVALVVLVGALVSLGYIAYTYLNSQKTYDDIAEEVFSPPPVPTLADFTVDWEALRAMNPDVVGWVYMPGTQVNYPIAWREGDDEYYLHHNFKGEEGAQIGADFGCIMLAGENKPDFSDQLNMIYGHNMANGSMFAQFAAFAQDNALFNQHRVVYVLTPGGNYQLVTIAVDRVHGSDGNLVQPNFATPEEMAAYIDQRYADTFVAPDPVAPPATDITKLFAFSTCTSADATYRDITYAYVADYVSADQIAAGAAGAQAIDEAQLAEVEGSAAARAA